MIFHLYFICLFVLDVWKDGWEKLRAPSHKATFICKVIEVEKYPREETSYYFISERDSYRSKEMHTTAVLRIKVRGEAIRLQHLSSMEAVNMRIGLL